MDKSTTVDTVRNGNGLNSTVFAFSFVLFYLWDFYLKGVGLRIFDMLGLLILLIGIAFAVISAAYDKRISVFEWKRSHLIYLLVLLDIIFVISGLLNDIENAKACVGFLFGNIIFLIFYATRLNQKTLLKCINIVLVLSAVYLIVQMITFYAFGRVLNIQSFLGAESRALSAMFRPTGIFLEPAGYCLSTLMLLALKMRLNREFDFIAYFSLITIMLSLSLWGVLAALAFFVIYKRKNKAFLIAVILGAAIFMRSVNIEDTVIKMSVVDRVENVDEDESANVRYKGVSENDGSTEPIQYFVGKGVGNEDLFFGYNGLSFLMSAGGYLGGVLVLIVFWTLMKPKWPTEGLLMILLCMTAWPIWTHFYWWAWLGLMFNGCDDNMKSVADTNFDIRESAVRFA